VADRPARFAAVPALTKPHGAHRRQSLEDTQLGGAGGAFGSGTAVRAAALKAASSPLIGVGVGRRTPRVPVSKCRCGPGVGLRAARLIARSEVRIPVRNRDSSGWFKPAPKAGLREPLSVRASVS
jgi:hypothetical protein